MNECKSDTRNLLRPVRFFWPVVILFSIALLVRMFHVLQIRHAPFFEFKIGDAESYDAWARQLAAGDWLGNEVFYQAPLYPYFLGVIYATLGDGPLVVRICQALIGAMSCVMLASAGRRFFSRSAGIVAGLLLAMYPPAIFFDGLIQKSVLDVFLLSLILWLISMLATKPRVSLCGFMGLAVGCLVLARENAMVFVAVILIGLLVNNRNLGRRSLIYAGMFLIGVSMVLFPVAARNKIVGGEFHLTTSQFGPNFFIGNNEKADGTYNALRYGRGSPQFERQDATELAEQALGRKLRPAEVSSYWTGLAVDYITSHPGQWLVLIGKKIMLLFDATERVDSEGLYAHAQWSTGLRWLGYVFHFGVLVPMSVFGMWMTWPKRRSLWLLYLMMAVYAASILLFYVFARYRYPLVPFLVLFAAAGVVQIRGFFAAKHIPKIVGCLMGVASVAMLCNWSATSEQDMRAVTYMNLGALYKLHDRLDDSETAYRQAIEYKTDHAKVRYELGVILIMQGKVNDAIEQFKAATKIKPLFAKPYTALGAAYLSQGRLDEAINHYRQVKRLNPGNARAYSDLGEAFRVKGDLKRAIKHYKLALQLNSKSAVTQMNLGVALAMIGRINEAIRHFEKAVRLEPDLVKARFNLGRALLQTGHRKKALVHFHRAVVLQPDLATAIKSLGVSLGELSTSP